MRKTSLNFLLPITHERIELRSYTASCFIPYFKENQYMSYKVFVSVLMLTEL